MRKRKKKRTVSVHQEFKIVFHIERSVKQVSQFVVEIGGDGDILGITGYVDHFGDVQ